MGKLVISFIIKRYCGHREKLTWRSGFYVSLDQFRHAAERTICSDCRNGKGEGTGIVMANNWQKKQERCARCGHTENQHRLAGLCNKCFNSKLLLICKAFRARIIQERPNG